MYVYVYVCAATHTTNVYVCESACMSNIHNRNAHKTIHIPANHALYVITSGLRFPSNIFSMTSSPSLILAFPWRAAPATTAISALNVTLVGETPASRMRCNTSYPSWRDAWLRPARPATTAIRPL